MFFPIDTSLLYVYADTVNNVFIFLHIRYECTKVLSDIHALYINFKKRKHKTRCQLSLVS